MDLPSTHKALLLEKAKQLGTEPGVYLMKDESGHVLYVGKAKSLRARVSQYFQIVPQDSARIEILVSRIRQFDIILTQTESEALLLEASLIKKHKPKFNIRLKDDKAYPYIKVNQTEDFPRLQWTRRVLKDGALYFGPFPSAFSARLVMRLLTETFKLRDCSDNTFSHRSRPCILFQMERCSAPCVKYVEVNDYKHQLEEAVMVLSGKGDKLCNDLKKQMQNYAEAEDFEQAALIRDQLQSLELVTQMQTVVQAGVEASKDVMAVAKEGFLVHGVVLQIRGGKLLSVKHYDLQNAQADMSEKEILSQFLIQHYTAQEEGVSSVLLSEVPEDLEWIEKTLQISIFVPDSAFDQELINVAKTNALHALELFSKRTEGHGIDALEEVQKKLNLLKLPERIECYDISNIQGEDAVASRVVFIDGAPDKNLYRRYKIKTVEGANDFAMMKEVLGRRFARTEDAFPDLVLVDGGKGQLSQASQILEELNVQGVEIAGLAKARTESNFKGKEVRASMERIFLPNRKNPVFLSPHTLSFKILTHLRDEAHRFAITYHRKLRDKIEPS